MQSPRAQTERDPAGDPLVGRVLDGRYRIGDRVARGGMASVYRATDLRLDRVVAVKVMHAGMGDDEEFAARFVREARAAARLAHPHVVGVFDQGEDDGVVFLAMEYVPGHTLRDEIRDEAPMPPIRALALIEPVVSALAAAHQASLIHRDVKPENVLIGPRGVVKVADFGLAKAVSADTQHTVTGGVLIGTVSYLAPELVTDGRSDARADVYAVGVVLFELLTGQKPHEGESPIAVAYKHVHADVPAPSSLLADRPWTIPPYVDALVARATARDRSHRPSDAGVLLHLIHQVSQALRDGLTDDPELTADLRPRPAVDATQRIDLPAREDTVPDSIAAVLNQPPDAPPIATRVRPPDPPTIVTPAAVIPAAGGPPAKRPAGNRPPKSPRRPRRLRGPLILLLAVLLLAGGAGGAYWLGVARYTTTPGVLGLTEKQAIAKLEAAGLSATTGDPVYSETVPVGEVLTTDPEPGGKILGSGTVTVVVSLGKERYGVPELAGKTEDQAQDALLATKLGFGQSVEKFSETVPEGQVIRSDPAPGESLKPGAPVDLVVSKGRKPIQIKDWTGRDFDEVETILERKKLEVERLPDEFSDTVPEGVIISQSPTEGTLFRGETVSVTVSKGPELIEIPGGLVASGVEAATETLESLGFKVVTEESDTYIGLGYVLSVEPGQGSMAAKGSTVTLNLV